MSLKASQQPVSPELKSELLDSQPSQKRRAEPETAISPAADFTSAAKEEQPKDFKCGECGKVWKKQGWLERHKCPKAAAVVADSGATPLKRKRKKSKRAGDNDDDKTDTDAEAAEAAQAALLTAALQHVEPGRGSAEVAAGGPADNGTASPATNKRQKIASPAQMHLGHTKKKEGSIAAASEPTQVKVADPTKAEGAAAGAGAKSQVARAPSAEATITANDGEDSSIDGFDFEDYEAKLEAQRKEKEELSREVARLKTAAATKIAMQKAEFAKHAADIAALQKQRAALTRIVGNDAK